MGHKNAILQINMSFVDGGRPMKCTVHPTEMLAGRWTARGIPPVRIPLLSTQYIHRWIFRRTHYSNTSFKSFIICYTRLLTKKIEINRIVYPNFLNIIGTSIKNSNEAFRWEDTVVISTLIALLINIIVMVTIVPGN